MAAYDANGMPEEFTSLWYRLRAIKGMTKEQMESALAFLAGFTETGWDRAYEQSGADPIVPIDGDPDYDPDYGKQLVKESRYLSLPDPEIGTRIEWIKWKLGNGPMPGSPEWEKEKGSE